MFLTVPVFAQDVPFSVLPGSENNFSYYLVVKDGSPSFEYYVLYFNTVEYLVWDVWKENKYESLYSPYYYWCNFGPESGSPNPEYPEYISKIEEKFPGINWEQEYRIEKWYFDSGEDVWVSQGTNVYTGYSGGGNVCDLGLSSTIGIGFYQAKILFSNFDLPQFYRQILVWEDEKKPANPFPMNLKEVIRANIQVLPRTILGVGSVVLPRACLILAILLAVLLIPRFLYSWSR